MTSGPHAGRTEGSLPLAVLPGIGGVAALAFLVAASGNAVVSLARSPGPEREIAGYVTSLRGRTASQRRNARLAAQALDGVVIGPGAGFSFNRTVKSWSADRGYVKAPVSYDGELIRAFGGGVCQTSTTLYNAALLAGMRIVERHHHVFAPRYIAPGRDAAVAYPNIDLRFVNPGATAVRLRASARSDRLEVHILGTRNRGPAEEVASHVLSITRPQRLTNSVSGLAPTREFVRCPGLPGYRVVTWRVNRQGGGQVTRERLSDDTYPAMARLVRLPDDDAEVVP